MSDEFLKYLREHNARIQTVIETEEGQEELKNMVLYEAVLLGLIEEFSAELASLEDRRLDKLIADILGIGDLDGAGNETSGFVKDVRQRVKAGAQGVAKKVGAVANDYVKGIAKKSIGAGNSSDDED